MPMNYRRASVFTGVVITLVCCYAVYQKTSSQPIKGRGEMYGATGARYVQKEQDMYVNPRSAVTRSALCKKFKPLPKQVIAGVEKFVFFVGKGKSGTTITASLMDAHPNMIVSNEYFLKTKLLKGKHPQLLKLAMNKTDLFNRLYKQSWEDSCHGATSVSRAKSGHHYGVGIVSNFSWHGMYKDLKVIGDKDGYAVGQLYQRYPIYFRQFFRKLSDTLQIPIQAVHMIRNPYDAIASKCLTNLLMQGRPPTETNKYNNTRCLKEQTIPYFSVETGVMKMKNDTGLNLKILDIHNADFVKRPVETVRNICEFFEVDCPEGYLQACKEKAYSAVSKTRRLVVWPKELRKRIDEAMKKFPFFQRYSYDSE